MNVYTPLLNALNPLPIISTRKVALWQRVYALALAQKPDSVRAEQVPWQAFLPGIAIKILHSEPPFETAIWRLQPGARIPSHPHAHEEHCLILQGSLLVEQVSYRAGDFLMARPGATDPIFHAPEGALLLIRAGLRPQIAS